MKSKQKRFIPILILVVAVVAIGGGVYLYKQERRSVNDDEIQNEERGEVKVAGISGDLKIYTNTNFGVEFKYPIDKVSTSSSNFSRRNSGRFANFEIKTGGNFVFDILEDSDKMTPQFSTELEEVKFKFGKYGDSTKYSQISINGNIAYKIEGDVNGCALERIVTKKNGYWYEFEAKVCEGNFSESLSLFESVAYSLKFTK